MSESKRKAIEDAANDLAKSLTDQGKLIEAGYAVFANCVIPRGAPEIQFVEMKLAFMAGAEHVFSSIMNILDTGEEPTDADLRRMDLIHKELESWRGRLSERAYPVQGSA